MNSRGGRYPPGNGNGREGSVVGNPNFYARNPQQQQQYVQRNTVQGQHNEQQQWLRRNQMGSDSGTSEVVKSVLSPIASFPGWSLREIWPSWFSSEFDHL